MTQFSTFVAAVVVLASLPVTFTLDFGNNIRYQENDRNNCGNALGLESGRITNSAITASSSYDAGNVGPQFVRLRQEINGGAWCPKQQVMRGIKEWIQVDLTTLHAISAIQTQGRFGNGQGQEYVEEFKLEYWRPGMERWRRYRDLNGTEIFPGNINTYSVVENVLEPVIIATKIRLVPHSLHRRTVCLRLELLGCRFQEGIVSYSMPQGDVFDKIDVIDESYDGIEENGYLKGGLGQLTDGRIGYDDVKTGKGKGYEWVGWQNKSEEPRKGLEMIFEFDEVRNFSRVDIHTNNDFGQNIQVFSEVRVFFSVSGRHFRTDGVEYFYMPDVAISTARNVSINLGFQLARYVRLQFTFVTQWLLLSEIYFHSEVVGGNYSGEIRGKSHLEELPLQRDAVINMKTVNDNNLPLEREENTNHTGMIIGIMTSIIIALAGTIVVMSLRNRKQNGGHYIVPASFGGITLKELGLGIKSSTVDFHFTSPHCEPLYAPVETVGGSLNGLEKSSIIYNEPFVDNSCFSTIPSGIFPFSFPNNHYDVGSMVNNTRVYGLGQSLGGSMNRIENLYPSVQRPTSFKNHLRSSYPRIVENPVPASPQLPPMPSIELIHSDRPHLSGSLSSSSSINSGSFSSSDYYARIELPHEPSTGINEHYDQLARLRHIPSDQLKVMNRLARGCFGEVYLCHLKKESDKCESVLTKRFPFHYPRSRIVKECKILDSLHHENLLQLLGLTNSGEEDLSLVVEYGQISDLCQFLQEHVAETSPINGRSLSYGCLIYMGKQIAAAMEYLESQSIVHRDLAARNCLVGAQYMVKIATFGFNCDLYPNDYYHVDGVTEKSIPLRWMAWESVTRSKFSPSSDVWSFAIILWEVLTFAREQPMDQLNDEEVVHLLMHYHKNIRNEMLLPKPILCPKEIYDIMCECWQQNEEDRPTFKEIHMFLMRKNLGYDPKTN